MNRRTIYSLTFISDLVLINLAFVVAYLARYEWEWLLPVTYDEPYTAYLSQQVLLNLLLLMTFAQHKVWRRRRGEPFIDELSRILSASASGVALMMVVTFIVQPSPFSRLMLIWVLLFTVLFVGLGRLGRRWSLRLLARQGRGVDRVLVIGSDEAGRGVIRTLLARPDLGYRLVGYLDEDSEGNSIGSGRVPHLGTYFDLGRVLGETPDLHTVFIALPGEKHRQILALVQTCQLHGVRPAVVPDLLQLSLNRVEFTNMAGIPTLGMREVSMSPSRRFTKRALDVGLIVLFGIPALLVGGLIALAIKLDSPGPIIYASKRIGRHGKPFTMYKFRSMVVDAEARRLALEAHNEAVGPIFKMRNDPRQTRVGKWLRRLSLDELPQLYNVVLGEMSLVGPRPPLPEEVAQYKPWHMQRLAVIGGLTGLWQVSGRSDLTFDELCLLDIYYVENWSVAMDLRILLQTIPYALSARGAY